MTRNAPNRGYSLIELIVSMAIFSMVMLIASAAFLALIQMDRQARATNDVVTNLSYVMDSMVRSIRTGSNYQCGTGDCATTPRDTFSFIDSDGRTIAYSRSGTSVRQCVDSTCMTITDPRITVETLAFYVLGTAPLAQGDRRQPQVIFLISGSLNPSPTSAPVKFTIESMATQRLIDL